jgi:hypothetical protein
MLNVAAKVMRRVGVERGTRTAPLILLFIERTGADELRAGLLNTLRSPPLREPSAESTSTSLSKWVEVASKEKSGKRALESDELRWCSALCKPSI